MVNASAAAYGVRTRRPESDGMFMYLYTLAEFSPAESDCSAPCSLSATAPHSYLYRYTLTLLWTGAVVLR